MVIKNSLRAHAKGHNTNSIGICLIGTDKYTKMQWQGLKSTVRRLQDQFSDLAIIGHCDVNNGKTCPGFAVSDWLDNDKTLSPDHIYKS